MKGVGKPKSKLTPVTQLFSCHRLMLAQGRQLDTVAQVQVVESFYELRRSAERLGYGCYLVELVDKSTEPGQPNEALFDLLRAGLRTMASTGDLDLAAQAFEARFLALYGYAPSTEACAGCGQPLRGRGLRFVPAEGSFYCARCGSASGGIPCSAGAARTVALLARAPLERLSRLAPRAQVRVEVEAVLRAQLDYHLGLRLQSLLFLKQLREAAGRDEP